MEAITIKLKKRSRNDIKAYAVFFLIISVLAFLVFKEISLPRTITIPIIAGGVIALIFGSFTNPGYALLILTAYLPFSKILVGQFGTEFAGLNLTNALLLIVIFGWVFNASSKGEKILQQSSLNSAVIIFCVWGLFTVLRARYMYGSDYSLDSFFILFKRWVTPIFLYFIGLNMVKDERTFKRVLFVMMFATFLVALMAVYDYMRFGDRGDLESSRIGGVFEQPNTLAAFFVYNMFFFLGFFLYYWKKLKYFLLLIPFLACFRGIMVTFSRGAYIAFGFASFFVTFFRSKILWFLTLFLLLLIVLNPMFLPRGIQNRLASTFGGERVISADLEEITDKSANKRILIWKGALEMIKEQPLFGFGYGAFPYIIGKYVPEVQNADAHNTYLIIAAEMGIPALAIFLIILLMLIKNSWWLLRRTKDRYFKAFALGMLGCLFGLLMVNMFGSRLNAEEVSSYFWLYAGLTMAAVRMKQRQEIA